MSGSFSSVPFLVCLRTAACQLLRVPGPKPHGKQYVFCTFTPLIHHTPNTICARLRRRLPR